MEEIYANVDSKVSQNQRDKNGHRGSERRCHGAAVLCLGLLSVFLLVGLISLGVHYHDSIQRSAAERDLLNASTTEMTKELERLQHLLKQRKKCPPGWSMFGCSCYLLSNKSDTWEKGREDCRDRGGDLVVIDSHKEEVFLSEFTKESAWIGLSDRKEEGTWEWIDGMPLSLMYWQKPQPDNGGGDPQWGEEDCAEIRTFDETHWNDLSCETSLRWICEKNITLAYN